MLDNTYFFRTLIKTRAKLTGTIPFRTNLDAVQDRNHVKLYTDTLFRTKRPKTIPFPAARPRMGHREYTPRGEGVLIASDGFGEFVLRVHRSTEGTRTGIT